MKQLTESGLVNVTKRGTWNHYSINKETIEEYTDFLKNTYENSCKNESCNC